MMKRKCASRAVKILSRTAIGALFWKACAVSDGQKAGQCANDDLHDKTERRSPEDAEPRRQKASEIVGMHVRSAGTRPERALLSGRAVDRGYC